MSNKSDSPAPNPELASTSSATTRPEDDTLFSTSDDLFSSIYDDSTSNLVQDTNASQDIASSEANSSSADVTEHGELEGSNFKLAEREFDETELEREQKEEEASKERKLSENVSEECGSDGDQNVVALSESSEWQMKDQHVFILSESGKPIYSL